MKTSVSVVFVQRIEILARFSRTKLNFYALSIVSTAFGPLKGHMAVKYYNGATFTGLRRRLTRLFGSSSKEMVLGVGPGILKKGCWCRAYYEYEATLTKVSTRDTLAYQWQVSFKRMQLDPMGPKASKIYGTRAELS